MMRDINRAVPLPDRDSTLLYVAGDKPYTEEAREFYVRGAIAWPMAKNKRTNEVEGFAIVLCQDVKTQVIYAQDSMAFVTIDPIMQPGTAQLLWPGLAHWLNTAFTKYACERYFVRQPDLTHSRWRAQVRASQIVARQPSFSMLDWADDEQAELALWEKTTKDQLEYWGGEDVHKALNAHHMGSGEMSPQIWALMVGINGLESRPWRPPAGGSRSDPARWPRNPQMRLIHCPPPDDE